VQNSSLKLVVWGAMQQKQALVKLGQTVHHLIKMAEEGLRDTSCIYITYIFEKLVRIQH
jgi:hypothetical protein